MKKEKCIFYSLFNEGHAIFSAKKWGKIHERNMLKIHRAFEENYNSFKFNKYHAQVQRGAYRRNAERVRGNRGDKQYSPTADSDS